MFALALLEANSQHDCSELRSSTGFTDAVHAKIPMWLVMIEMTPEEVAVLDQLLTKCEERSVSSEGLWKDGESEEQRILCELVKEVHRGR
jgi:uncharacterized protein (DUF342 family)